MSGAWRGWALTAGALLSVCGIALWVAGGGPILFILGIVGLLTGFLEPIYGRITRPPLGGDWKPTDERFVDPESGKPVTVWFDPASGQRRYVADEEAPQS